jgi:hypothetical protein
LDLGSVNRRTDRPTDGPKWSLLCTLIKINNYWDILRKESMVSRGNGSTLKLINKIVSTAKYIAYIYIYSFIASIGMEFRSQMVSKVLPQNSSGQTVENY